MDKAIFGATPFIKRILFSRTFFGFLGISCSFLAIQFIPIGETIVLMMLSPLWSALGAYLLLGEPWWIKELGATVVSIGGAILVARPAVFFGSDTSIDAVKRFYGITLALLASITAAGAFLSVRVLGTTAKMPWVNVCFCQSLGYVLFSLPGMYITGHPFRIELSGTVWLGILVGASLGVISQIAMTIGMQKEKSATSTAMRMSDVPFSFVWQAIFTNDKVYVTSIFGALIITSSILTLMILKETGQEPDLKSKTTELSSMKYSKRSVLDGTEIYSPVHSHSVLDEEMDAIENVSGN